MIDRRFPTALQVMQTLVHADTLGSQDFMSSAQFAQYTGANPTLVRKLVTSLVQSGLLRSQMGRSGGVRLARDADQITLYDIYQAVIAEKPLWSVRPGLPRVCFISTNFAAYFERLERDADAAISDVLLHRTLAQSYAMLRAMAKRKPLDRQDVDTKSVLESTR